MPILPNKRMKQIHGGTTVALYLTSSELQGGAMGKKAALRGRRRRVLLHRRFDLASVHPVLRISKPLVEQLNRFGRKERGDDLDVASAQTFHVKVGDSQFTESGALGVGDRCAVDDAVDPGPVDGREAHWAGLGRRVNRRAGQLDVGDGLAGGADGGDLSMSGGVGGSPDDVVLAGDHRWAAHDARAKG